jgi:hypothetical protein
LRRARSAARRGDVDVFAELFDTYQKADDDTRHFLERDLPALLAEAEPLGRALRSCPEGVAVAFCADLESRLTPSRAEVPLAARVFASLAHRTWPPNRRSLKGSTPPSSRCGNGGGVI